MAKKNFFITESERLKNVCGKIELNLLKMESNANKSVQFFSKCLPTVEYWQF